MYNFDNSINIIDEVVNGNIIAVREWLDDSSNYLNICDSHGLTLIHMAAIHGHTMIAKFLIDNGILVDKVNMTGDTPLHMAASYGNFNILKLILSQNVIVDAFNKYGNTPLHYACFFNHLTCIELLINNGANVMQRNLNGKAPIAYITKNMRKKLTDKILRLDENSQYKVCNMKNGVFNINIRPRNFTKSVYIDIKEVSDINHIYSDYTASYYSGVWKSVNINIKTLICGNLTKLQIMDFKLDFLQLRIFNNSSIRPVIAAAIDTTGVSLIYEEPENGCLYDVIHGGILDILDYQTSVSIAKNICDGMNYLHNKHSISMNFTLSSFSISIGYQFRAQISMFDYRFNFLDKNIELNMAYKAPESISHAFDNYDKQLADIWSFGVILWEMVTNMPPFKDIPPMVVGLQICLENLRLPQPTTNTYLTSIINMCLCETPSGRPQFNQLAPILKKMLYAASLLSADRHQSKLVEPIYS
ncbi:Integrin-linked protein kinase [Intoshia linei]|uniref:Integrin-linked protein kinase n=1 Tax=Intoshia linei TaxID=1819745 RepID=A0A177AUW2_9BILA|nr:Integrin-linked protein kinase [Intoshia linei]